MDPQTKKKIDYVEAHLKIKNPAFPIQLEIDGETVGCTGLSKREYMAAKIMASLLTNGRGYDGTAPDQQLFAKEAVKLADALLAELKD